MLEALLGGAISAASNLFAGNKQRKAEEESRAQNIALQKEFAQSGIQWKVEDAKKAGIHPLYALGASTNSFSPVAIGDTGAGHMAQAGQDIGRAIQATRTPTDKVDAVARTMQQLQLTRMGLENELLASQIAKVNQGTMSAGMPDDASNYLIDGQGNAINPLAGLKEEFRRSPSRMGHPSLELGSVPDIGYARGEDGTQALIPSMDVKQRIEDMALYEWQHFIRNNIAPFLHFSKFPDPPHPAPMGHYWTFNPLTGNRRIRSPWSKK